MGVKKPADDPAGRPKRKGWNLIRKELLTLQPPPPYLRESAPTLEESYDPGFLPTHDVWANKTRVGGWMRDIYCSLCDLGS